MIYFRVLKKCFDDMFDKFDFQISAGWRRPSGNLFEILFQFTKLHFIIFSEFILIFLRLFLKQRRDLGNVSEFVDVIS